MISNNLMNPIPDPYDHEDDGQKWHSKRCTICGTNYHKTKDCSELACFTCGEKHFTNNCPYGIEK